MSSAWLLAHDASLKIIIVTHAEHLSKTISRNIRTILQSPWYKELFASRIKRGHSEVTDFGTTSGGGVFVSSFRGSITGRRAHVIIVDDPHDIGDDIDRIEATVDTFNTVLLSRLNNRKTGRVLVVAHRGMSPICRPTCHKIKGGDTLYCLWSPLETKHKVTRATGPTKREFFVRIPSIQRTSPSFAKVRSIQTSKCCISKITTAKHRRGSMQVTLTASLTLTSSTDLLSVDAGMTNTKRSAYSVIQVWRLMDEYYELIDEIREQADFMIPGRISAASENL